VNERLFISLALPAVCQDALAALCQRSEGIDWTPPEQLHLTMRFLGEIEPELISTIEDKLAAIRVGSFLLPLENTGVFPPRGVPKVLWAGIGKGDTRLFQLRQRIDDALLAAGWRGLMRSFDPHITLGRIKADASEKSVVTWLQKNRDFSGPPFRVEAFHLVASELRPTGAIHEVRRSFPLLA
jgi:RNA 2',3'-cyclic 3'-phosphodiesterase